MSEAGVHVDRSRREKQAHALLLPEVTGLQHVGVPTMNESMTGFVVDAAASELTDNHRTSCGPTD